MQTTQTITETGCYLDNHRGHYIQRDMIELAVGFGFIIDGFEAFALARYATDGDAEDYPFEELTDLADRALAWLNVGDNSGPDRPIRGQNQPPRIPEGYAWDWYDGDFGLYSIEDLCD